MIIITMNDLTMKDNYLILEYEIYSYKYNKITSNGEIIFIIENKFEMEFLNLKKFLVWLGFS